MLMWSRHPYSYVRLAAQGERRRDVHLTYTRLIHFWSCFVKADSVAFYVGDSGIGLSHTTGSSAHRCVPTGSGTAPVDKATNRR